MTDKFKAFQVFLGPDDKKVFWGVLIVAVILTVIGIYLGNPFEDYQTSSTL